MSHSENILDQLKSSVQAIIDKTGAGSKYTQNLVSRIQALQQKLESLSNIERSQFLTEMQGSFQNTINKIEQKLTQHANFEKVYNYSIISAVVLTLVVTVALFGYKLYKSLMEKELKKQEKVKNKHTKKSKKNN
ncbi:uncharacterized protein LOC119683835 [Teleopsis dalmanni]|uniref:uncharacterized protein LOC119683835 n=1 Tax=Teleopsis dalmanni TaxID=139649 RepID=UPI0018CF0322|nr:uncharacterized protein LOC119683835 [Teleopsis dalmanni]